MNHCNATSTQRAYDSALRKWLEFSALLRQDPWRVSESSVLLFIGWRFDHGIQHASVLRDLNGIRHHFTRLGIWWPSHNGVSRIGQCLKGFKRLRPPGQGKTPFPVTILRSFLRNTYHLRSNYRTSLDRALLSLPFQGLFRASELVLRNVKFPNEGLTWGQLSFENEVITISLSKSKMNQFGTKPESVSLNCQCHTGICAYHCLLEYISHFRYGVRESDLFFVLENGSPVSYRYLNDLVKRIASIEGFPMIDVGTHSLRKGGATTLYSSGVPTDLIKRRGRWSLNSSTAELRYFNPSAVETLKLIDSSTKL